MADKSRIRASSVTTALSTGLYWLINSASLLVVAAAVTVQLYETEIQHTRAKQSALKSNSLTDVDTTLMSAQ